MPELPDVTVYVEHLEARLTGQVLTGVRLKSPFLLRSVAPPLSAVHDHTLTRVHRIGKRIVFSFEDELYLVLHLMIAGRFRYRDKPGAPLPGRIGQAAFDFSNATLLLTEAGTKRRASLYVVEGEAGLQEHDRGGIEVLDIDLDTFRTTLTAKNHTLKRALTDPRIFSGIGNAYSDEILFAARLSPLRLTQKLNDTEIEQLYDATRDTLTAWTDKLRAQNAKKFPEKVTAFHDDMAVHGKYRAPCPVCQTKVQRIVYAENETNYCPQCQNEGRVLKDRSLSRLLKDDWPKTVDELEKR